jgi:DNA-directed RNA polymerase III subunit RPC6
MHIRSQTNLHQTVVNKVLKALEGRNEIKVVKSIKVRLIPPPGCALSLLTPPPLGAPGQFPTRKLYMLFHLTPSVEMTGGPWFTDHELDTEFIKQLLGAVLSFIKQRVRLGDLKGST